MRGHDVLKAEEGDQSAESGDERIDLRRVSDSIAFTPKDLAENGQGVLALYELARSLAGHAGLADTADVIVKHLREVIPASLCVLFVYQAETDDIVAVHSSGTEADKVKGLRLKLGAGVSGWVAAHRKATADADARLELSRSEVTSFASLTRALSAPLMVSDNLVGAITLYRERTRSVGEMTCVLLNSSCPTSRARSKRQSNSTGSRRHV